MRIYIAGKYTGLDHNEAVAKFRATKQRLIAAGFQHENIIDPTEHIPEGTPWQEAMDILLPMVETSNMLYVQRDWYTSFGARNEINAASSRGILVVYESPKLKTDE